MGHRSQLLLKSTYPVIGGGGTRSYSGASLANPKYQAITGVFKGPYDFQAFEPGAILSEYTNGI